VNFRSFFAELKRPNVYKVATAYGLIAWLLMQIATQVFSFLEINTLTYPDSRPDTVTDSSACASASSTYTPPPIVNQSSAERLNTPTKRLESFLIAG
jgi:hypothetical protein